MLCPGRAAVPATGTHRPATARPRLRHHHHNHHARPTRAWPWPRPPRTRTPATHSNGGRGRRGRWRSRRRRRGVGGGWGSGAARTGLRPRPGRRRGDEQCGQTPRGRGVTAAGHVRLVEGAAVLLLRVIHYLATPAPSESSYRIASTGHPTPTPLPPPARTPYCSVALLPAPGTIHARCVARRQCAQHTRTCTRSRALATLHMHLLPTPCRRFCPLSPLLLYLVYLPLSYN